MLNQNKGYISSSRSVRSQEAIDNYEVPVNKINKSIINSFLKEYSNDFDLNDLEYLKSLSYCKWKYVAVNVVHSTSWHHTSSYFNETNHYDLSIVAEKIIEIKDTLDDDYKEYSILLKQEKEEDKLDFNYGVIKVAVFGGTRKKPKLIGYNEAFGIIIGNWLFYKNGNSIEKYNIDANKVEKLNRYNSYNDLVKNHKEYKNTKRIFNYLISEKVNNK